MDEEDGLTGHDYMTRSYIELQSHPDFSERAFQAAVTVKIMNTRELELLYSSIFP